MTTRPHPQSAFRLLRKRAGLTQADVAYLMGYRNHSPVSRLEQGRQVPQLDELFMIEFILGASGGSVFSQSCEAAGKTVAARIGELQRRSQVRMSVARASYKAEQLGEILASIRSRISDQLTDLKSA